MKPPLMPPYCSPVLSSMYVAPGLSSPAAPDGLPRQTAAGAMIELKHQSKVTVGSMSVSMSTTPCMSEQTSHALNLVHTLLSRSWVTSLSSRLTGTSSTTRSSQYCARSSVFASRAVSSVIIRMHREVLNLRSVAPSCKASTKFSRFVPQNNDTYAICSTE